jgi:hypothetical protein
MQALWPILRPGHQFFDHGAKLLRLGQRRGDLLVLDQRTGHVGEHGNAMRRGTVEAAAGI